MTTSHHHLLRSLAQANDRKIVLLVLDGIGDLASGERPRTPLEAAATPHLDALARRAALGRIVPVAQGVTPGSGPGHLALFGYDPKLPETDIGRGVLEALGVGMEVRRGDVLARGNFANAGTDGKLTDRRAGRPSNDENRRLVGEMQAALDDEGLGENGGGSHEVTLQSGEGHRFVLRLRGGDLSADIEDTDPQALGVPPKRVTPENPGAEATARVVERAVAAIERAIAGEPKANRALLRGFSKLPDLEQLADLYRLRCAAFAGYPLYRGVAQVCGMEVFACGKKPADLYEPVAERWGDFDYFFLHVKQTDMAGEDGDFDAKRAAVEAADELLPRLLDLGPAVVAITGDHSTPVPMKAHSWHPVPLLLWSDRCFVDDCERFTETEAVRGHIGTIRSMELMGLLLGNAGRLAKFGA